MSSSLLRLAVLAVVLAATVLAAPHHKTERKAREVADFDDTATLKLTCWNGTDEFLFATHSVHSDNVGVVSDAERPDLKRILNVAQLFSGKTTTVNVAFHSRPYTLDWAKLKIGTTRGADTWFEQYKWDNLGEVCPKVDDHYECGHGLKHLSHIALPTVEQLPEWTKHRDNFFELELISDENDVLISAMFVVRVQ